MHHQKMLALCLAVLLAACQTAQEAPKVEEKPYLSNIPWLRASMLVLGQALVDGCPAQFEFVEPEKQRAAWAATDKKQLIPDPTEKITYGAFYAHERKNIRQLGCAEMVDSFKVSWLFKGFRENVRLK